MVQRLRLVRFVHYFFQICYILQSKRGKNGSQVSDSKVSDSKSEDKEQKNLVIKISNNLFDKCSFIPSEKEMTPCYTVVEYHRFSLKSTVEFVFSKFQCSILESQTLRQAGTLNK